MGVIGVAVGTAILPVCTRQLVAGQHEAAIYSQNRAIEFSMFFTIPLRNGYNNSLRAHNKHIISKGCI